MNCNILIFFTTIENEESFAKSLLTIYFCCTVRGITRGQGGRHSPGTESLWGHQITAEAANKFQQCHKYFVPYSTFVSERPQVRTWGHQTFFLLRQNRRQIVFNRGALHLCGGTWHSKNWQKLHWSVSCYNLEGLGDWLWGAKPTEGPRGDGTVLRAPSNRVAPLCTVRIAIKNETKQTSHHRNMKRSLLINTTLISKFKRYRFCLWHDPLLLWPP